MDCEAEDGEAALRLFESARPEILFLDVEILNPVNWFIDRKDE